MTWPHSWPWRQMADVEPGKEPPHPKTKLRGWGLRGADAQMHMNGIMRTKWSELFYRFEPFTCDDGIDVASWMAGDGRPKHREKTEWKKWKHHRNMTKTETQLKPGRQQLMWLMRLNKQTQQGWLGTKTCSLISEDLHTQKICEKLSLQKVKTPLFHEK